MEDQQLKREGSQPFDEEKKKLQLLNAVLKAEFAELEEEKRKILDEKEQYEEKKRLLDEKEELGAKLEEKRLRHEKDLDIELSKLKAVKEELNVELAKLKAVFADLGKKKRLLDEKKEQFYAEFAKLKAEFAELERKKRQLDGELAKSNLNLAELDELKAKLKGQEVELDELKAKLKDEFSQLTELRKTLQVLNAEFREREKEKLFDTELEKKRRSYIIFNINNMEMLRQRLRQYNRNI
ncbi:MAR-binding filament-like protein 1 [Homarus americanus]|uniref:MAR-binding filament-like protein 1 n=1 Tax=Homarus americanus TaxID=6706 RepID=UPI001C461FF2|nr:MAR-binding filament-like protein 1 [Homarus americanus]